ncbi:MAG: UDP-glucose 4-epimerase GalE [Anaerolineae bacterium UTCFX2]|jgi:UDP-glucose 4-epimerase|nr:UDP-glucose 4-epimerase GalE [Anaerolineales bacterium]OQY88364.1 MAG: UDP-glucose 4-epimerase GalE [Anaerolineae bacterium UTCFX2]
MHVLVTGGAGYIGSHTCLELLLAGNQVTVVDNLVNSKAEALRRVESLAGKPLAFHQVNLCDRAALARVFRSAAIDAVIHFAALKAPGESVSLPLQYYSNNITGSLNLFEAMAENNVQKLVFSSSATVYGDPASVPITEDFPCERQVNPYGHTKRMVEIILEDLSRAEPDWSITVLRYFNPVGAHPSGRIGEDPLGIPNNLLPYIAQVAVGRLPYLRVWGDDYPTPDGTGVRDYIHVVDLALGHLKALEKLADSSGCLVYNLGANRGYSVLEMLRAFEKASGRTIPYRIEARRPGDIAVSYADTTRANRELGWRSERTIDEICQDTWRWQSNNPQGYE